MANAFTLFGTIKVEVEKTARDLKKLHGDLEKTTKDLEKAEKAGNGATSSFASMAGPAKAAGAAIAIVGVGALKAASALWDLMRSTSEYGSAIYDATQKTGLTAKTISALQHAANQSGASMQQITGAVAKFNVVLGEAQLGNKKAESTLKAFNITSRDTDKALQQAITTIAKETDVTKQAAMAKQLFKDRTADILPVIASFNGDLPALMAKLEKLGLIMSDESAMAADEFGDTLDTLTSQAAATGRAFALELMPAVTGAMQSISEWMAENKNTAIDWGRAIAKEIGSVRTGFATLVEIQKTWIWLSTGQYSKNSTDAQAWAAITRGAIDLIIGQIPVLIRRLGEAKEAYDNFFGTPTNSINSGPAIRGKGLPEYKGQFSPDAMKKRDAWDYDQEQKALEATNNLRIRGLQNAASAAKEFASKTASALMSGALVNYQLRWDELKSAVIGAASKLEWYGDTSQTAIGGAIAELSNYIGNIQVAREQIEKFENAQRASMVPADQVNLTQKQLLRQEKDREEVNKSLKVLLDLQYKRYEDISGLLANQGSVGFGLGQEGRAAVNTAAGGLSDLLLDIEANPFEKLWDQLNPPPAVRAAWDDFWATMNEKTEYWKSTLPSLKASIGENLINSIYAIGDVFGQAVANWDGTAKGFFKSLASGFKQMVGQIIGELVKLMVIKAIMSLIGGAFGGFGGGSVGAALGQPGRLGGLINGGGLTGAASGGLIRGPGSGTSDSIPARLSNGEYVVKASAVRKWGSGFFEALNNMSGPAYGFAGGGMVGGSTYNNQSSSNYHVVVNMPSGNGGGNLTRSQIESAVILALNKHTNRNK